MKSKQWVRVVFRRRVFVISTLLVQIGFIIALLAGTGIYFRYVNWALNFLSIVVCVHVLNKREKSAYKLTWIFLIMLFPFFGGIMYIIFYSQSNPRKLRRLIEEKSRGSRELLCLPGDHLANLIEAYPEFRPQAHYLQEYAGFPVYIHTRTEYFDSGESFFQRVLAQMEKAERYIFLEFFILREGVMLNPIISLLERKAREGLDVRVMYDDLGCFMSLPQDYRQQLEKKGIKCFVFNPFKPILSSQQNNRDHRKIISIDGKVAFTGSLNLADEYINAVERFGHWKDAAIMLEGEGAWSLTLIFLQMWNLRYGANDDYVSFYPWKDSPCDFAADGFVQPYADSPIDQENVGEHVYIQIINNAKKYVYINTPYLVIDDNLLSALTLAAKSGVDVRIITPHRWDKWIVAITSRSYYRQLISAGVKIYEYSSGFNHSKTFVSDDKIATVGTTNLDFRSLYLHFECGVLVYKGDTVRAVKEDFLRTIPISQQVGLEDCARNTFQRIIPDVLRIFAPLM
ncbi:MAG: cardiolipin synthase [Treponema sp.]|jgi:cardiolipin synthase|nr:cardiolipin synthase [Treponema sp.]